MDALSIPQSNNPQSATRIKDYVRRSQVTQVNQIMTKWSLAGSVFLTLNLHHHKHINVNSPLISGVSGAILDAITI